jgi:hypothetical protein
MVTGMKLTDTQTHLLLAIAKGLRLKDHRDLDGHKQYVLHNTDDVGTSVAAQDVEALTDAGLISSNKKFPAATYWLTEDGKKVADQLQDS